MPDLTVPLSLYTEAYTAVTREPWFEAAAAQAVADASDLALPMRVDPRLNDLALVVLVLLRRGLSRQEVADRLNLSRERIHERRRDFVKFGLLAPYRRPCHV